MLQRVTLAIIYLSPVLFTAEHSISLATTCLTIGEDGTVKALKQVWDAITHELISLRLHRLLRKYLVICALHCMTYVANSYLSSILRYIAYVLFSELFLLERPHSDSHFDLFTFDNLLSLLLIIDLVYLLLYLDLVLINLNCRHSVLAK